MRNRYYFILSLIFISILAIQCSQRSDKKGIFFKNAVKNARIVFKEAALFEDFNQAKIYYQKKEDFKIDMLYLYNSNAEGGYNADGYYAKFIEEKEGLILADIYYYKDGDYTYETYGKYWIIYNESISLIDTLY